MKTTRACKTRRAAAWTCQTQRNIGRSCKARRKTKRECQTRRKTAGAYQTEGKARKIPDRRMERRTKTAQTCQPQEPRKKIHAVSLEHKEKRRCRDRHDISETTRKVTFCKKGTRCKERGARTIRSCALFYVPCSQSLGSAFNVSRVLKTDPRDYVMGPEPNKAYM